ncbi:MAG: hypothetical protein AUJ96_14775 [Armatimonadetes bacterium CG2_30_66_41]|nr:MAG: hypothetical protein AUJ96_14775 [Armatimonadetes bacterium CG2_30_66_41]
MNPILPFVSACLLGTASVAAAEAVLEEFQTPPPPGPHCPLTVEQLKPVESYRADQPVVGTYFFYWYDIYSKAHFVNGDGSDALVDHPVSNDDFSFKSVAWWKRELQDVTAAGIDFILPVYWGCPGDYAGWSFAGLPPLVEAWEELTREGKAPPRVGLFYDTSTLQHNPSGKRLDLSLDAGKQWFYATVRDFFSFLPPKMWAAVDGRPIVVLYSPGFAAKQDPALFPFVREHFRQDFATDLYLVKSLGWEGEADNLSSWGGALGLKAYGVTALGPGYDHHAVPGRAPLVVDREGGAFYSRMWEQFLAYNLPRRAKIVLVETWNELHEGTDICDTKEYGRRFIDLTAKYAKLFKEGVVLPKTGPFADAQQVEWDASRSDEKLGIALRNSGDGLMEPTELADRKCWRTRQSEHGGKYAYVDLDDGFLFDEADATLLVEVEYLDRGFTSFLLEYDSADPTASVREGAFKALGQPVQCGGTGDWKRATLTITGARLANRCNGGDLRFAVLGGELAISRVTAKRDAQDK